jgi:hypothetical protein
MCLSLARMTEGPKASEKALREQRLQAALRENLKRRKAQSRGRLEQRREACSEQRRQGHPAHDSAGIGAEEND